MKFRFTISGVYEIPDEELEDALGTANPEEVAKIEEENLKEDPSFFMFDATEFKVERDLQAEAEKGYREAIGG